MKEFTSIESFRHIVASVKRYCAEHSKPLPTIEYVGTVKLHGTNAGVRVTPDMVQPQKRSDIVTIGADNAGFAAWCHDKDTAFRQIAGNATKTLSKDITLYGEWCGGSIQKGVALNQLEKHFVIFAGYDAETDKHVHITEITAFIPQVDMEQLNSMGIWFINQIDTFRITIDFRWPEESLDKLNELTLAVEEECPWGKFRGVSGVGEGIVWIPATDELSPVTGLWFKTKGGKHAAKGAGKTNVAASPEKLDSIKAVVEAVLPAWRLEQGLSKLKEEGLPIEPKSTGIFLQWVSKDILKEEADVITANGLDWKTLVPFIMREARSWYLKKVDEEAFAT
jgi:hypothetical protein